MHFGSDKALGYIAIENCVEVQRGPSVDVWDLAARQHEPVPCFFLLGIFSRPDIQEVIPTLFKKSAAQDLLVMGYTRINLQF